MAIRNIYKRSVDGVTAPGFFGSSLAEALVVYRRRHPLNPTVTELALAATALFTPQQLEKYCGFAGRRFSDSEVQAKMDEANEGLLNKLVSVARGTHPNADYNEQFRSFYNEWKDTPEGAKYAPSVIQFNPTGPTGEAGGEADEYIQAAMAARAMSRGTGGAASASARLKQAEAAVREAGGRSVSRQKLANILGMKIDDSKGDPEPV